MSGIETKICCEVGTKCIIMGPAVFKCETLICNYSISYCQNFSLRFNIKISMSMYCFSPVITIENAIILHRRYCGIFKIAAVLSIAHHSIALSVIILKYFPTLVHIIPNE